jgi:hypothetical protein
VALPLVSLIKIIDPTPAYFYFRLASNWNMDNDCAIKPEVF